MINQVYYKKDLPSGPKGKVIVKINDIPEGKYLLEICQTGYRVNDPYSSYLDLGSPHQLSVQQTKAIQQLNDGSPTEKQIVIIAPDKKFERELSTRENDVFFLRLSKI